MRLYQLFFTENNCYKAGATIKVKGIMVHSTGANNPWLRRYVGPDDGRLGPNAHNNHWNQPLPGGREVCVHGFIGRLADGSVATYQTLPWEWRGWHAGGRANDEYIGFEICEDDLTDSGYFAAVYREAAELCAWLCTRFQLTPDSILCHSEGHALGIASNHADVMHWFPRHGKSMDSFRADVRELLASGENTDSPPEGTGDYPGGGDSGGDYPGGGDSGGDYPEVLSDGYYRVRGSWDNKQTQIGAYRHLSNAKRAADDHPGTFVFTEQGEAIYPAGEQLHTVAPGESLWEISARYLGAGNRYREIMALNRLTSDVIWPGQRLRIPK